MTSCRIGLIAKQAAAAREGLPRKKGKRYIERIEMLDVTSRVACPIAILTVIVTDEFGATECTKVNIFKSISAGCRSECGFGKAGFAAKRILSDIDNRAHTARTKQMKKTGQVKPFISNRHQVHEKIVPEITMFCEQLFSIYVAKPDKLFGTE